MPNGSCALIVVAAGEDPNPVRQHLVDQPVLLVNPPGPASALTRASTAQVAPDPAPPTMSDLRTPPDRIQCFSQSEIRGSLIQRYAGLVREGAQQALPHVLGLQQISGFALRSDLSPECDWHDNGRGLARFVRYDLDIVVGHNSVLTPSP